ncbi:hypothetical protein QG37_05034 [Candidozyma auris]|nr:hypothetical protein QG37_05034 [[Candida] auris]
MIGKSGCIYTLEEDEQIWRWVPRTPHNSGLRRADAVGQATSEGSVLEVRSRKEFHWNKVK